MDEIYVTYVDDEHVHNHDYDDDTDDDKAWRRRDLLLAGRTLHTLRTFRKEQNSSKKVWPPPLFVIFYPASRNQAEKFIYQFFKAQVTGKSIYFCEYTFFYFLKRVKLEK